MFKRFLKAIFPDKPPIRFFLRCHHDGIPPKRVREIVAQYGKNVLIGVDPGLLDYPVEESQASIDEIKKQGARFHIYLVGPGMETWSKDEAEQIRYLADSIGIDTSKKNWNKIWKSGGWEKKIYQQFEFYNKMGAHSIEIDNLDGIWDKSPIENFQFCQRLQKFRVDNKINTKLVIKNLDKNQLNRIKDGVRDGELSLDLFANFGMFEKGSGTISDQIEICKDLGIKAVTPRTGLTNTFNYGTVKEGVASL